jgi:hypothetical protein
MIIENLSWEDLTRVRVEMLCSDAEESIVVRKLL